MKPNTTACWHVYNMLGQCGMTKFAFTAIAKLLSVNWTVTGVAKLPTWRHITNVVSAWCGCCLARETQMSLLRHTYTASSMPTPTPWLTLRSIGMWGWIHLLSTILGLTEGIPSFLCDVIICLLVVFSVLFFFSFIYLFILLAQVFHGFVAFACAYLLNLLFSYLFLKKWSVYTGLRHFAGWFLYPTA